MGRMGGGAGLAPDKEKPKREREGLGCKNLGGEQSAFEGISNVRPFS